MLNNKTVLRVRESLVRLFRFAAVGLWTVAACAAEPESNSMIHLINGDYVTGRLVDSASGDSLWWQSPAFVSPFQFGLASVNNVQFPSPAKFSQPEGEYCFELAGHNVLFGSLVELQGNEAVIDATGIGSLHVDRSILRRMYRWHGAAEVIFFGPSGLKGWHTAGAAAASWREEVGNLVSNQSGAVIRRDFGLPPQARFEFELSWKEKADFELALGANDAKQAQRAFRFEIFDNELVVQRETERQADLASLQTVKTGPGHIHLQAFLDQQKGRILVFSSSGQQLADLTVEEAKPKSVGGLQLTNRAGDIRLERLSIGRWNGDLPRTVETDKSRIHVTDGSIIYGQLKSFDAAQHEFTVESNSTEQRIAEDRVQDVFFSQEAPAAVRTLHALRAAYLSGQRVSGRLVKVEQNKILLKCPGIREELVAPIDGLQSLTMVDPRDTTLASNTPAAQPAVAVGHSGRLELPGAVLRGNLAETEQADANCLVWKPARSLVPSALIQGLAARIFYRDLPPSPPKPPTQQQGRGVQQAGVVKVATGVKVEAANPASKAGKPVLHLRSGDTIPCDVTGMDEKGVTFTSANTDTTFIPHTQLKVLELFPGVNGLPIPKTKKERLLMLPRMQRDNPPTHLIRSIDGDYLRGRIVSMDEQQLQVEIRLETKALHRERVARIIWFHPDELSETAKPPSDPAQAVGARVQALRRLPDNQAVPNGNRLTFIAEQVSGNILSGRSEFLGVCRVDLQQIDQLLIGPTIEQEASTLPFQWRLKSAVDPLAAREDGGSSGDGAEGQDAALVGKMAPDFELDMLDGARFRLSAKKDKILVLDFWASWCGPCLQVMPQIDKVVEEFADRGVELVAINLEETNDRVKATLDRLKLEMPVAFDRNGRIAEKYGATAIPQTVIIDRGGKVVRLFVGGGPRFGDQLRAALEAVLGDNPDTATKSEKPDAERTNDKPVEGE